MWPSLIISTAFVPGWTGVSIPTNWIAMSLLLPWLAWKRVDMTPLHWLGLAFLVYAGASILWSTTGLGATEELWHWGMFTLCFMIGSQTDDLRPLWKGFAIGCGISSAVAVAQWFGASDFVLTANWGKPPGLFFNNAVAGAVAAMVIAGLASEFLWVWALPVLPLLVLSQSRGAWAALAGAYVVTILARLYWRERLIFLCALAIPAVLAVWFLHMPSDNIRWGYWSTIIPQITWFGHGAGSSQSLYAITKDALVHLGHAHNDYLNLVYEYGLGSAPLLLLAWLLVEDRDAISWPPYVCGIILCLYFGTLETPVTGFVLCVVAGRLARDLGVAWDHGFYWGLGRFLCATARQCRTHAQVWRHVSV